MGHSFSHNFYHQRFYRENDFLPPAICSGQQLPLQRRIGDDRAHYRTKLSHSGQFPYLKTSAEWVTAHHELLEPTTNRVQSNLFGLPWCEGCKASRA